MQSTKKYKKNVKIATNTPVNARFFAPLYAPQTLAFGIFANAYRVIQRERTPTYPTIDRYEQSQYQSAVAGRIKNSYLHIL